MPHPTAMALTAQAANVTAPVTTTVAPMATEPNSTVLLWQYLGTVGSYTLLVIVGLLWVYWQLKKNPAFLAKLKAMLGVSGGGVQPTESRSLVIEETIQLDADKLIHLVRCEGEKFLMSNGPDGLKLLTKVTGWQETLQTMQAEQPVNTSTDPTTSTLERTQAVVDSHGDVHLTNTPHSVAQGVATGVSFPMGVPKTIMGQNVPWFTNR
jgi:hypothetical protein